MPEPLKIIYAGTPEFAAVALRALLHGSHHRIIAVYTQPDRPAGRGRRLQSGPVKELALTHGIETRQPESLRAAPEQDRLNALNADLMVVAAYGLLLPREILQAPRLGCINIHASLLPRWRGAAPIQRALLSGDSETGITIMQMDEGLDRGAMLHKLTTPINADDTAQTLHDRLATLGAQAIVEALELLQTGQLQGVAQNDANACYAAKLHKDEAPIDWTKSALEISRQVAAFNPWPVAQTVVNGEILRIWGVENLAEESAATPGRVLRSSKAGIDVACGAGVLRITKLQRPGSKCQSAAAYLNAHSLDGAILNGR